MPHIYPSFYRKEKKKPFRLLKENSALQESLLALIQSSSRIGVTSELFKVIETFVCHMYSLKTENDVDKKRYDIFERSYKKSSDLEHVLKKSIKSCDTSNLPPSKLELLQQIKRTIYISNVWCNAHKQTPTEKDPLDF